MNGSGDEAAVESRLDLSLVLDRKKVAVLPIFGGDGKRVCSSKGIATVELKSSFLWGQFGT